MIKVWLFTLLIVLFTISHIQCATNQSTIASMNNCRDWIPITFFFQAKQRASIKWLLSKAYDHRTPEELREPFYKDHDVSFFSTLAASQMVQRNSKDEWRNCSQVSWISDQKREKSLSCTSWEKLIFFLDSLPIVITVVWKSPKNVSFATFYTLTEIATFILKI